MKLQSHGGQERLETSRCQVRRLSRDWKTTIFFDFLFFQTLGLQKWFSLEKQPSTGNLKRKILVLAVNLVSSKPPERLQSKIETAYSAQTCSNVPPKRPVPFRQEPYRIGPNLKPVHDSWQCNTLSRHPSNLKLGHEKIRRWSLVYQVE